MAIHDLHIDPFSSMSNEALREMINEAERTLESRRALGGVELTAIGISNTATLHALGEVACPILPELHIDPVKLQTDNELVREQHGDNVREFKIIDNGTFETEGTQITLSTEKTSEAVRLTRERLMVFFINKRGQKVWTKEIAEEAGIEHKLVQNALEFLNRRFFNATGKHIIASRKDLGGKYYMHGLADDIVINESCPAARALRST